MYVLKKVMIIFLLLIKLDVNVPIDEVATKEQEAMELQKEDFSVSNGFLEISLDMLSEDFEVEVADMGLEKEYVGEIFSETTSYHYFSYDNDDVMIFTSNVDYDMLGRDFYEYHVSQITVETSAFITPRGITVGAEWDEVVATYGQGEILQEDGKKIIVYCLDNWRMEYVFDEEQSVLGIYIYIA